jgi:hypothetical protein
VYERVKACRAARASRQASRRQERHIGRNIFMR